MNNSFLLHQASSKSCAWSRLRLAASSFFTSSIRRLWRAADLGPIVTFVTGVIVGLLIPSRDWVAIAVVIVAGVILRRIVKIIDKKLGLGVQDVWPSTGQKGTEDRK